MDLYEYQARDLFDRHGVPMPPGALATTPEQARRVAQDMFDRGSRLVVVKAQVKIGGRGKAGGVKPARTAEEAGARAAQILGMDIKGHPVRAVLVADGVEIASEFYVALLLDRAEHRYLVMCSREGGMDIEALAAERPEALARIGVDPLEGVTEAVAARVVRAAGFEPGPIADAVAAVVIKLWEVFAAEDATLVEVNPLVLTPGGDVLALDGKVSLDDNAAFRHPERAALRNTTGFDPLEARAKESGLNYVRLDGQVGVLGNGAGLVMSTLDVVAAAGRGHGGMRPANFLDLGGGPSAEMMATGLEVVASDPQVRAILVNVFGGITSCDTIAEGIVTAVGSLPDFDRPIVVRLDGNNAELGRRILAEAAIDGVMVVDTMDGAADAVTAIAQRITERQDAEREDAVRPDGEQRATAQHTAVQQGA